MSTKIEWTDETWNPVVGCTHVSDGCGTFDADGNLVAGGCYAARQASGRLSGTPTYAGLAVAGRFTGEVRLLPKRLAQPLRWRASRLIFVNSMSDLFHAVVPYEFIVRAWAVMALADHHVFQLLSKRHARLREILNRETFHIDVMLAVLSMLAGTDPDVDATKHPRRDALLADGITVWPLPNVWVGVSVEDQRWADGRIPALLGTPAAVRFLSCEPLLGAVDLTPWLGGCAHDSLNGAEGPAALLGRPVRLWECGGCSSLLSEREDGPGFDVVRRGLGWVIAGGESGPKARPTHPGWIRAIRDACAAVDVAFHFKQWGEWGEVSWEFGRPGDVWVTVDGATPTPWTTADNGRYPTSRMDESALMRRYGKKVAGRQLYGRTHDESPTHLPERTAP